MTNVLVAPGEATTHSALPAPVELDSMRQENSRWRPIGEVLVAAGAITREELQEALHEQRESGKRLGEVLIEAGILNRSYARWSPSSASGSVPSSSS